ncbi:MAG TPA: trigger factor [Actinobacteria bacterium]|mgnify:CR=1 FL=1|nr:trigger factor [Actinomycetota bacterium]
MDSSVDTLSPTRVKVSVQVPADEMQPSIEAAYDRISRSINVPGFRKGKVPRVVIDQRVGRAAVLDEALNDILNGALTEAVQTHDLKVIGQPKVDIDSFEDGQALSFTAEIDIRPEFDLPQYKGIAVTVDDAESDDADVEAQVLRLRERFGSLKSVERAVQDGDFLTIDLASALDGEPIEAATATGLSYQVGSGDLVEGLDEAVVGLAKDASAEFTTKLRAGEFADRDVQVTVTVTAVRERELPEADDNFAQMASEFDTFAELREQIAGQTAELKRIEQALQARAKVAEALLAAANIPVPEGIVQAEVDEHLESEGRMDDDTHRAEVDAEVRQSIAQQFLLDEIAKAEELQATEAELTDYLVRQAARYGMAPDQFVQEVVKAGQVPSFVGQVVRGKAMALVLENAVITDASGRPVDLKALDEQLSDSGE